MSVNWTTASLRISSSTFTVAKITELLATDPSYSVDKGARLSPRNTQSAISEFHLWGFESGLADTSSLDAHLQKIIDFINDKKDVLTDLLSGCNIELICGLSVTNQRSVALNSVTLKAVTAVPMDIVFDLYGVQEDD